MIVRTEVTSFISGLLSPKLEGRTDFPKYTNGCRVLENFIVTPTGGAYKRPGTHFVAKAKTNNVRLIPFDFNGSETQGYVLEIGQGYIRFFTKEGQAVVGDDQRPLELTVTQLAGKDLTLLNYVQSADVIYFAHPLMQTWRLERLGATNWAYQGMTFLSGTGNELLPFGTNNWPSKIRLYEDRLVLAATPAKPVNIWISKLSDYNDFRLNTNTKPGEPPLPEDSIWLRLNGSRINPIQWLVDAEQLVVGTNTSEIRVQGRDIDAPLTPETAGYKKQSSYGSNKVQSIMHGESVIFCSRTGEGVFSLDYQDFGYRFKSEPLNLLAPNATDPGVVELHAMSEPEPIIWCVLADGSFSGCTTIKGQQIFAWHRHSTQGKVKSAAIIPHAKGDQLWFAVERFGEVFIEFMAQPFPFDANNARDTVFMDAHLEGINGVSGKVTGLGHLKGKTVQVVSDGSYIGELVVDNLGAIYDSKIKAASKVVAGLGYSAELQPTRPNYPVPSAGRQAGGQGIDSKRRVVDVTLRLLGSIKGEVRAEYYQPTYGVDVGEIGEWQSLSPFPHGATGGNPPPCSSGVVKIPLSGNTSYDALIRIRQKEPFPLYVISLSYGIDQPIGV